MNAMIHATWTVDDTPIHHDLRTEAIFAKAMGTILALAGFFFFSFGTLLLAISTGTLKGLQVMDNSPTIVGWLVIATSFLVAFLLAFFGRHLWTHHQQRLRRASWLLSCSQPRKMHLVFSSKEGMPGKPAELRDEGKRRSGAPDIVIEIRSPYWKTGGIDEEVVQVYQEPDPEGIVVMVTSAGILWGFMLNRDLPVPIRVR